MAAKDTLQAEPFTLPPADDFLVRCPKFRLLVLGNMESTKIELFSRVFGLKMDKSDIAAAFSATHDINTEIDTGSENPRLILHTSANFNKGDNAVYKDVADFLKARQQSTIIADRIHCIWYCVSCDFDRTIHHLETEFFRHLPELAPSTPTSLIFTKYEELVASVRQDWYRDEQKHGISEVAASRILRDLTTNEFEKRVGRKWDAVVGEKNVSRLCVATDVDDGSGHAGMEMLTTGILASLKGTSERLAFAAAQRGSPAISTKVCADIATGYFTVGTGHVRKRSGVEVGKILQHFFDKSIQVFNFDDPEKVLLEPRLLDRILGAVFDATELAFLESSFDSSGGQALIDGLTPHDRSCMLTQAVAGVLLFFHKLAESQWLHRDPIPKLTAHIVDRELSSIKSTQTRRTVLSTIESSPIFAHCQLISQLSELILEAVGQGHKVGVRNNAFMIEDESELQEMSLNFINDHPRPDDVVLPNGMTILALN